MSLEDDLLRDLESDIDSESDDDSGEVLTKPTLLKESTGINGQDSTVLHANGINIHVDKDGEGDVEMDQVQEKLDNLTDSGKEVDTSDIKSIIKLKEVSDVTRLSKIQNRLHPVLKSIEERLPKLVSKKDEADLLTKANHISVELSNEVSLIHSFIKAHYSKRFSELESLIPDPIEYSRVVKAMGNDLEIDDTRLSFLTKEKILVLTMATIQAKESYVKLEQDELENIVKACDLLLEFEESKKTLSDYISSRLAVFAPNLTYIVGPTTAAQLYSIVGGLTALCSTPSCNIAALGSKRSIGIGFGHSGIRQQGYLYYSDVIQSVSPDLRKQAMRIVSGKLILAARVDLAGSIPDGSQGRKWAKEIQEKIEKLDEPPENKAIKALPLPIDKPSKKRAGRKYRKMKQRFEASELRKAQNRVEFGKQENTVIDSYGEEIGLGMTGSLSHITVNSNTNAKFSKKMKNRLEKTAANEELFSQDFINIPNSPLPLEQPPVKKQKK